jgi:hypothetical protein
LSSAVEAAAVSSSASVSQVRTLSDMRQKYRFNFALAKRFGLAEWYIKTFGSEKKWLSQFKRMPYDVEDV